MRISFRAITDVIAAWGTSVWKYFTSADGYKVIVAVGVAYVGLDKILEGRYEYIANQAISEKARLISSASTASPEAFGSALVNFGPVQAMLVPPEPDLLRPWRTLLGKPTTPNREPLWIWARDVFDGYHRGTPGPSKSKGRWQVDLRWANFRGADLHELNLSGVDLRSVNLEEANLQRVNLQDANLVAADLEKAHLNEANLRGSNLTKADLEGADLSEANLITAILRQTDLRFTKLTRSNLSWSNLRLANLTGVTLMATNLRHADCGGAIFQSALESESAAREDDEGRCPSKIRYKIGVSYQTLDFPFVAALQKSAQKTAKLLGVDLVEADAQNKVERETDNVTEMANDIDCLAFEAVKLDEWNASIDAANQRGVPVVQFNGMANGGDWITFVGSEQEESGDLLAKWLVSAYKRSGRKEFQGVYLRGLEDQVTDVERAYALKAGLKKSGYEKDIAFVHEVPADYDRKKAKTAISRLLVPGSNLDFIVANNDSMILGALDALEEMHLENKIALAGIDGLPETLKNIRGGKIAATVFQDAEGQGAGAIQKCVEYLRGKTLDKEYLIPFKLVTIDNVSEFRERDGLVYESR
jgi:inositol transport system substrate-binding protein